jgi:hypothetical protein
MIFIRIARRDLRTVYGHTFFNDPPKRLKYVTRQGKIPMGIDLRKSSVPALRRQPSEWSPHDCR